MVGWVIGRGGTRIKNIMRTTETILWIDQDVADDADRILYIKGQTQDAIDAAKKQVEQLISEPFPGNSVDELTTKIIECPADLVGLLIGYKGQTIKSINKQTGVQISINQCVEGNAPRKIVITGAADAVKIAEKMV